MPELILNDRPLVPVRLVPFVTGWDFSPDILARILANRDMLHRVHIPSFHLQPDGTHQPMVAKEWDTILADMVILTDTLKSKESADNENYPLWRKESIKALPAATFVWQEDLEEAWSTAYSEDRISISDERPDDRSLNLRPWIPAALKQAIYEGFESLITIISGDSVVNQETPDGRKHRLEAWYHEECNLRGDKGALNRTAKREGVARQTLSEILKR